MVRNNLDHIESHVREKARSLNIRKVLVALSGGADSIATCFALKNAGMELKAMHCNFHLRGEESNRDSSFVKRFCDSHDIQLITKDFDVNKYVASHKGVSVEMACRDLRHEWFRELLEYTGFQRIATGHNADDNIETFLLNMLRGSGSRGLKGMTEDNGIIWRPLLSYHKKEILEYLCRNNLDYVTDSTNLQNDYRRNFLRNVIVPLLKKEWKGFEKTMDKTIHNLETENYIIEKVIAEALPLPGEPIKTTDILASPAPLLIIKRYIDTLKPYSTTAQEILAAIKADKPHIRRWRLKKGMVFLRNRELFVEMSHGEGSA